MSDLQNALQFAPANFMAVSLFDAKPGVEKQAQVDRVAGFMKAIESLGPKTLKVLTAVNPQMISDRLGSSEELVLPGSMPRTQNDVVIQMSAENRRDYQIVQRLLISVLNEDFNLVEEIDGGNIFLEQEAFGFYHADPEEQKLIEDVSEIKEGDLAGGTWLLYQKWIQKLEDFFAQSRQDQLNTVGGNPVRTDFWDDGTSPSANLPDDAHTKVMKSPEDLPEMVRRSFSYRKDGDEGVVFMATSASVEKGFNIPLQRMAERDKLMQFAEAIKGGLYFVPPSGAWLSAGADTAAISKSAEALLVKKTNNKVLNLDEHTFVHAFVDLLDEMVGTVLHPEGIDEQTERLVRGILEIVAGGNIDSLAISGANPGKTQQLNAMLDEAIADAAFFNKLAGKYMVSS